MVKVHARRRGLGRGRGGFASLAHGGHNNLKGVNPLQSALPGKAHKHKQKHQHQHQHKPKSKTSDAKHTAGSSQFQSSSLGDDLDSILHANTLVKHIDPPFTELEDDFSRLKTQSIELATLVLHLQNSLEVEQQKHKKSHPPAPIPLARSISQDSANSGRIKTTTVKAPPIQTTQATQSSASDPFSIIYSTSPRRWSSRRTKVPSFPTPKTPGTAGSAGSPMSAQMVSPSSIQLTPTLDRLLDELHDAIQTRDGDRITRDLQIEPPLAQAYADLQMELQKHYPWGKDQHLRTLCERVLPKGPDGVRNAWESFAGHLLQYLQFIRDFAPQNLLKTNDDLKLLLKWVRHVPVPAMTYADAFFQYISYLPR